MSPVCLVQKNDEVWRKTVHYHKLNQVVTLITTTLSTCYLLWSKLTHPLASSYATIGLAKAFFSVPVQEGHLLQMEMLY